MIMQVYLSLGAVHFLFFILRKRRIFRSPFNLLLLRRTGERFWLQWFFFYFFFNN
uniref:Uncharacterized protein n=1 Tax=Rhizophora mucronata TaxID=61149 RepID=A0A2P2N6J4_RHIMU